jgi:hypothetical protein
MKKNRSRKSLGTVPLNVWFKLFLDVVPYIFLFYQIVPFPVSWYTVDTFRSRIYFRLYIRVSHLFFNFDGCAGFSHSLMSTESKYSKKFYSHHNLDLLPNLKKM